MFSVRAGERTCMAFIIPRLEGRANGLSRKMGLLGVKMDDSGKMAKTARGNLVVLATRQPGCHGLVLQAVAPPWHEASVCSRLFPANTLFANE